MKDCVLMRTAENDKLDINWTKFAGLDRHEIMKDYIKDELPVSFWNRKIQKDSQDFTLQIYGYWRLDQVLMATYALSGF